MPLTALARIRQALAPRQGRKRTVLLVLGLFILAYAIGNYGGPLDGVARLWWSDAAWTLISLAAGLKCLHTAAHLSQPCQRQAWVACGIGALLWFTGMLIWDYQGWCWVSSLPIRRSPTIFSWRWDRRLFSASSVTVKVRRHAI